MTLISIELVDLFIIYFGSIVNDEFGTALTVIVAVFESEPPDPVAVKVTVNVPADVYVCFGF